MSQYWLMKSEPDVFSIEDLRRQGTALWDGVRNYQARNFMTQSMKVGDWVLFYHSNAEPPGVAGLAKVSAPAKPDPTAWDKKSKYYDERSTPERPVWFGVEVEFVERFPRLVPLSELREQRDLKDMLLLKRGQRLSIQPVTKKEFECIKRLAYKE